MSIPYLPNGSIPTSRIGIGCAYLTEGIGLGDGTRIVHAAFDAGARHFDVAPQYGYGTAEKVLGHALRDRRPRVTIASKVGIPRGRASKARLVARALAAPLRTYLRRTTRPVAVGSTRRGGERRFDVRYVESSLRETLRYLATDYLDAWLLHMVCLEDITDELLTFLFAQREAGRVRSFGLATARPESERILAAYPNTFDIAQHCWSVLDPPLPLCSDGHFLITHRTLARAYRPLREWFADDREACRRLSGEVGVDLADAAQLSSSLIGASLAANPAGISLVASHDVARTQANVAAAQDEHIVAAGRRLADLLLDEPRCPRPLE